MSQTIDSKSNKSESALDNPCQEVAFNDSIPRSMEFQNLKDWWVVVICGAVGGEFCGEIP